MLVALGHFDSRASAQAAIVGGLVCVNGQTIRKASTKVSEADRIEAQAPHPWVSRGGIKLDHALTHFAINAAGRVCLDVGASTGGFTQVLLERGASKVFAVDVGRGQRHDSLAAQPRVIAMEATDARSLSRSAIDPRPSLIVCDASFIALEKLLDVPLSLAASTCELVCLFKPQFQVGRAHVGKGGIVTDKGAVETAEKAFCAWLDAKGWQVEGRADSPIAGGDGNRERLVYARAMP